METRASLKHLRVSPQKARLVVDQIRGQQAERALELLELSQKAVARDVRKLLYSALANARENEGVKDESTLKVTRAWVDAGPTFKRVQARAMGRAFRIIHRTSHIHIVLSDGAA